MKFKILLEQAAKENEENMPSQYICMKINEGFIYQANFRIFIELKKFIYKG